MEQAEHFVSKIAEAESDPEKKQRVVEMCRRVIEKVFAWAQTAGINISDVKKLGGGYVNPVLMIETEDGQLLIAKGFVDPKEAATTKYAQKVLGDLAEKDEEFIPKAVAWIDDETLLSEAVDGEPLRKKLAKLAQDPDQLEETVDPFEQLGILLAKIHERTEQPAELVPEAHQGEDKNKLIKHLRGNVEGIIDFAELGCSMEDVEKVIQTDAESTYVSLIHGDAHLDQFFRAPQSEMLTIVDYDSLAFGDPMADVARSLSSLRSLSQRLGVPPESEMAITKAYISGYREVRKEQPNNDKSEFDYKKVIVYELRLYLVELKMFSSLRKEVVSRLGELRTQSGQIFNSEVVCYEAIRKGEISLEDCLKAGFSEKQWDDLRYLSFVAYNVRDCVEYLSKME